LPHIFWPCDPGLNDIPSCGLAFPSPFLTDPRPSVSNNRRTSKHQHLFLQRRGGGDDERGQSYIVPVHVHVHVPASKEGAGNTKREGDTLCLYDADARRRRKAGQELNSRLARWCSSSEGSDEDGEEAANGAPPVGDSGDGLDMGDCAEAILEFSSIFREGGDDEGELCEPETEMT